MRNKISMIIILIVLFGSSHGWGGIREESINDPKIKDIVHYAFQSLESGSNNYFARKIIKIKSVKSQLVAGKTYDIAFEIGQTTCTSSALQSSKVSLEECPLKEDDDESQMKEQCHLKVWTRPWEDFKQVTSSSCEKVPEKTEIDLENKSDDKLNHDKELLDLYSKLLKNPKSVKQLHKLQSKSHFKKFMKKHSKEYKSLEEYESRYGIFKENMKKVLLLRQTEQGTAHYGASIFADFTEHEFKTQKLGLKPELKDPDVHWPSANIPNITLPRSFDWRDLGAVTPVKNQGSCGSCWAFSVTGNLEGLWFQKTKKLYSFSEQELVDCDKLDNGCNGGLPDNAYKSIIDLGGLELEDDYSYDGVDEKCHIEEEKPRYTIDKAVDMPKNETKMAQWLVKNGPISIGLNANAMQFYMGGVSHPFKFLCSPENIDHGVLIVGYGIHKYPLFRKEMPYWIIKNSWGPNWGEQGYYRVYRGDGTCGVNQMASSAIFN